MDRRTTGDPPRDPMSDSLTSPFVPFHKWPSSVVVASSDHHRMITADSHSTPAGGDTRVQSTNSSSWT